MNLSKASGIKPSLSKLIYFPPTLIELLVVNSTWFGVTLCIDPVKVVN